MILISEFLVLTFSKDLQRVSITLRVLYRPEKQLLPSIYQRLGLDYSKNVFESVGNEVLKAIVVCILS